MSSATAPVVARPAAIILVAKAISKIVTTPASVKVKVFPFFSKIVPSLFVILLKGVAELSISNISPVEKVIVLRSPAITVVVPSGDTTVPDVSTFPCISVIVVAVDTEPVKMFFVSVPVISL